MERHHHTMRFKTSAIYTCISLNEGPPTMSGVEALGLACNIITVISFAHETISLCKRVYQGEVPTAELSRTAKSLVATSQDVQDQNNGLQQQSLTPSQRRLHEVAQRCNVAARGLQDESDHLLKHHKQGDLVAMMKIAAKSTWRKRRLDKLEKTMAECQREMDTQLLHRVWYVVIRF
jgi:hypothetical protein